jgi:hypothetical protein
MMRWIAFGVYPAWRAFRLTSPTASFSLLTVASWAPSPMAFLRSWIARSSCVLPPDEASARSHSHATPNPLGCSVG